MRGRRLGTASYSIVNGNGFPVNIGDNGFQAIKPEALETGIVDYDFSGDVKTVTGVQKRYENVEQYRTIEYDKQNKIVTIDDRLEASEKLESTILWHIAEDVDVEAYENGWNLYRDGELVGYVEIQCEKSVELETVIGQEGVDP